MRLSREEKYQELSPKRQELLKIRGNTIDEMEDFVGHFKLILMDIYDICILEDMDGPVTRNIIDGTPMTWQARPMSIGPIEKDNARQQALSLATMFIGVSPKTDPTTFDIKAKCKTRFFSFYRIVHEAAVDPVTFKPIWGLILYGQNIWYNPANNRKD